MRVRCLHAMFMPLAGAHKFQWRSKKISTQSKMTHSIHVAPSTMSLVLSPLSGSRWRMVFQISSSESTSLSLVLFCPALRSIPASTCSRDVATTAPGCRFMIPKADCLRRHCAICLANPLSRNACFLKGTMNSPGRCQTSSCVTEAWSDSYPCVQQLRRGLLLARL